MKYMVVIRPRDSWAHYRSLPFATEAEANAAFVAIETTLEYFVLTSNWTLEIIDHETLTVVRRLR